MRKTGNEIVDLSFEFALEIIEFVEVPDSKRKICFIKSNIEKRNINRFKHQ